MIDKHSLTAFLATLSFHLSVRPSVSYVRHQIQYPHRCVAQYGIFNRTPLSLDKFSSSDFFTCTGQNPLCLSVGLSVSQSVTPCSFCVFGLVLHGRPCPKSNWISEVVLPLQTFILNLKFAKI